MKVNPSKTRIVFITKGKLSNQRLFSNEAPIAPISQKPIKSSGSCYDASLNECERVKQLKRDAGMGLEKRKKIRPCSLAN